MYLSENTLTKVPPLNPRDAFYGGRVENLAKSYTVKSNEKIKYYDFISMYPTICKNARFPVGHPKVYVGKECEKLITSNHCLDNVFGLVSCDILPPRDLYIPVLPVKMHGKLLFLLCRTCGETSNQDDCTHIDRKDRMLRGVWVSEEIKIALQCRYTLINVYEIWQYNSTQYDPDTNTGGLFSSYINEFFKLKVEASGYPPECNDNESKFNFVRQIERRDKITLDVDAIENNPGLRLIAKNLLNSLWGRIGG